MIQGIKQGMFSLVVMACVSAYGYSNPIEGGATQTVTNDWDVTIPWLMVGANSASNSLVVVDGATVSNSIGYIGNAAASSDNRVTVTGSGSTWSNVTELSVGYAGGSNSLTVVDGGTVVTPDAYIGNLSDGNLATVTGSNSLLDTTALYVGYQGDGNRLQVTDGGAVESDTGTIGYWMGSDGNSAVVQSNGVWKSDEINVGEYGTGNQLTVGAGGWADAAVVNVGVQTLASNNMVSVEGSGAWLDVSDLYIGGSADGSGGTGNGVEVQNGGTIALDTLNIYDGNAFDLNAGGTLAVSTNFDAALSGFNFNAGGTLEVGGELTGMSTSIEDQRSLVLNGSNAVWEIASENVMVGESTAGNTLAVLDGGLVDNQNGYIGYSDGADSNSVLVSGSGSTWKNDAGLSLGGHYSGTNWIDGGTGNVLTVEDGGLVLVGEINSNLVSAVEGEGVIAVGDGAEMVVANESTVESGYTYIGAGTDGSSDVVVTGDSVWNNSRNLYVGYGASNNELTIENGATVSCNTAYVGNHSSAGNVVSVSGEGSTLSSATHLYLGGTGGDNTLLISDGATVSDSHAYFGVSETSENNTAMVTGDGSEWNNSDGLYVGWASSSNVLTVSDGGLVTSEEGRIGVYSSADDNSVVVDGADSVWSNSANLYVGWSGSGNSLSITNGGSVQNLDGYIGREVGADGNRVSVVGINSVWNNDGSLYLGGQLVDNVWVNGGASNTLYVADGGLVTVGEDLQNRNDSTLELDPGGTVYVAGDYYQDSTSVLSFGVETNEAGAPFTALLSVDGTAEFGEGAGIDYASNVGELQFNTFYTNMLVEADTLVVAGVTNANALDLELLDASGSLVDVIFWEDDQDIYAIAGRVYLTESAGFEAGTMMANLAGEMDDLSLLGNADAVEMINLLNTLSGEEQNEELKQQYERGAPSYLHIQGMTDGLREITKHVSQMPAAEPDGAAGPERPEDSMRGWVKTYGRWGERSAENSFSGYDHDVYGTVVGVDWVQGNVLAGVAGGYARSEIEQDDGDSSSATTCYGVGYMSMRDEAWFGDASLAIGRSSIEDESGSVFSNSADYNAANIAFYCGVGRDVSLSKAGFVLTPEASILLSGYLQDSYTEEGVLARAVSAYERIGAQSGLGATLSWRQEDRGLMFCPEIGVRWLHEFNADADTVDYSLAGGTQDYTFATAGIDEDLLEARVGLNCVLNDQCSLELNADWVFGEDYDSHAVSGRMIFEF